MGRKAKRQAAVPPPPREKWQWLPLAGMVVGFGLFLGLIFAIARLAQQSMADEKTQHLAFRQIECPPCPLVAHDVFLDEVRKTSDLPETLALYAVELPQDLAAAFARHPLVQSVEKVEIRPDKRVRVELTFRTPVLEVLRAEVGRPAPTTRADDDKAWCVDGTGVVLPPHRAQSTLPLLFAEVKAPAAVGLRWGDATVESAARLADLLRPHQDRLQLRVFECHGRAFVLCTAAGTRVLWGRAVGLEANEEAPAATKIDRLLAYCASHGNLDKPGGRHEHDVRGKEKALQRQLP